jgi:hypothetical protein
MNQRIRELYEQARLQAKSIDADIDPKGWMDLYHKKFAELIVRECDRYARSAWEHGDLLGRDLLIHFGVEE